MSDRRFAIVSLFVSLCSAACALWSSIEGTALGAAGWAFATIIWLVNARLAWAVARNLEEIAASRAKYSLDDPLGETIPN